MEFKVLYAINNLHNNILDIIMLILTSLGNYGLIWLIISIILLMKQNTRKCGIYMLISMFIGLIIGNGIIKNLIARPRPSWIDDSIPLLMNNPTDYSFPSGHTLVSFEAAVTIFLFNKKWGIPAIILALLVGISRMYLFVHYPTDILGGIILGTVISTSVFYIGNKLNCQKNRNEIKEL